MAIDKNYTAVGGSGADPIGVLGYAVTGYIFDQGVLGLGGKNGVVGAIDAGTTPPLLGFPTTASYITGGSGIFGLGPTIGGVGTTGVAGLSAATSAGGVGVFGQADAFANTLPSDLRCGVLGTSRLNPGVMGFSETDNAVSGTSEAGAGVSGTSTNGFGVVGTSNTEAGVVGMSNKDAGVRGVLGTSGPLVAGGGAGVIGSSDDHAGVIGTSNNDVGVYGFCPNSVGVVGLGALGGQFEGGVVIGGDLTVMGAFNLKGCAVPFPDGTHRVLYCMESPEVWFEDFGTAKLKRGRAAVKLDADFATVIKRGDYHVFLAPKGDCRGLYVRHQGGASFEVRELQGGTSSIEFSYRIVGRRKDVRSHKRFPKFDVPPMPAARRTGRTPSSVDALLAKVRKQAGARPGRARRRKTARAPQPLPRLLANLRKQAGAGPARRRKRGKKRA